MSAALRKTLDSVHQPAEERSRVHAETFSARIEIVAKRVGLGRLCPDQSRPDSRAEMAQGAENVPASGEESAARLTRMIDAFTPPSAG